MKVTEVQVYPVNEDKLKAFVSVILDDCFVVRDIKIIKGSGGLFVAMPSKKRKDGTFVDTAHPINSRTRRMLEDRIFEQYEVEIQKKGAQPERLHAGAFSTA